MIDLNNVYNYYHMTSPRFGNTKYDTHKTSELKNIYHSMIKLNRQAPLYKLTLSEDTQVYALGIKEAAIALKTSSAFLGDDNDNYFDRKTVASSNEQQVSASLLTEDTSSLPEQVSIEVHSLANPQTNDGNYLSQDSFNPMYGAHSFDITTSDALYHFDIDVAESESVISVQQRIANSINQSQIGVQANVDIQGESSALRLESSQSGYGKLDDGLQFYVTSEQNDPLIQHLGINHVASAPTNASFSLNGEEQTSNSNHISINNKLGLDLYNTTDSSQPVTIQIVPDTDQILSKIEDFVDSYNHLVDLAITHNDSNRFGSNRLLRDIRQITASHENALEASGLQVDKEGYLTKDESLLIQSTKNGQFQSLFQDIGDFHKDISIATKKLTMNPMEYVDKTIVTYPNTRSSFSNPYVPSIYSGMLYNRYV